MHLILINILPMCTNFYLSCLKKYLAIIHKTQNKKPLNVKMFVIAWSTAQKISEKCTNIVLAWNDYLRAKISSSAKFEIKKQTRITQFQSWEKTANHLCFNNHDKTTTTLIFAKKKNNGWQKINSFHYLYNRW